MLETQIGMCLLLDCQMEHVFTHMQGLCLCQILAIRGGKKHTVVLCQIVLHQVLQLFLICIPKGNVWNQRKSSGCDFNLSAHCSCCCQHHLLFAPLEILDVLTKLQSQCIHLVMVQCPECFCIHTHVCCHIVISKVIKINPPPMSLIR